MKILADQVKNSAKQRIKNNDKIYDWRGGLFWLPTSDFFWEVDWRGSKSEIYFEDFKLLEHFYFYILYFLYVRRMW